MFEDAYYVGLKHQEILCMTLNELGIFLEAYKKRTENENYQNDIRTARICCVIANCNSKKKFKESDFMPKNKKKAMSSEQFATMLKVITLANGGEIT